MPDSQGSRPGTFAAGDETDMTWPQVRASLIAVLILFLAGLFTLRDFLPALAWAVIFAIGVWPVFERLAHRWPQHRRGLLPAAVIAAVVLVFVIPLAMVAVPLAEDAGAATRWVEHARQSGVQPPQFLAGMPFGARLVPLWQHELGQPGQASTLAQSAMKGGGLAQTGRHLGSELLHRLVLLGFMLLALLFLLRDADDVTDQLKIASRRAFGTAGEDVGRQMVLSVHGTVNGLVLVGLGEGVLLGVAYWATGVPHPTLFGLFTAILAMIPFGAAIAFCIAGAALLVAGKVVAAIIVIALGLIVTFVADHFVRPVLIGGATRLPFIWVLLGILGGVEGWGLVGLFLGPAIMAALMLLWREWVGSQKGPINPRPREVSPS